MDIVMISLISFRQQLDLILEDDQSDEIDLRRKRQAEAANMGLWPNNKVYYYFDNSLSK